MEAKRQSDGLDGDGKWEDGKGGEKAKRSQGWAHPHCYQIEVSDLPFLNVINKIWSQDGL